MIIKRKKENYNDGDNNSNDHNKINNFYTKNEKPTNRRLITRQEPS